jgi:pyruvate ferredoxin oxidoreductase alpha subunit
MADFDVIQGNKALAYGVKLARVEVIPAYPITPQTTIIEYLAEFVANGELDAEYIHADGEHSCMAMAVGASLAGARVFTSTCSQGLAYMHECVAQAVNYRTPLLLGVANRTLGWFWSLGPDYSDIMPELNLGYLVNFAESNQEVLDMTLQLYKIAEDYRVLLPTMMSLDGFYLSYSQERVWMPDQEVVDKWLPPYKAPYPIDPTINDKFPTASIPPTMHTPMRRIYEEILQDSRAVIKEVDASFGKTFGRSYGGLVEEYRTDGAEALLVTMGSMTTAGRRAIDKLRAEGEKIGLVKLRFLRPFPDTEIREIASNVKAIGVVDRMMNHGTRGGGAFQDIKGALYNSGVKIPIQGFVTGMGGEDIPIDDMYMMGKKVLAIAKAKRVEKEVEFIEHKMPPMTKPVQLDWDESIYPASDGCAGCGASIIVRHLLKVLGPNTIVINPPNCSGVNYGQVVRVPWMLANFAAAAAYETGVYRAMKKKGKADKVWITSFAGDGGTADIGLQSLSGAAERGEPIMWLCYDNEAYMNTGIQRSGSTPLFSATTTTPAGRVIPGKQVRRKNLEMIMAAHRIPYIATASLSYLPDLEKKIRKAQEITRAGKGLAFLHVHQPCPTGWYFPENKTVEMGKLAVQTGAWPLMEIDEGNFKLNLKPKELRPIAEYLKPQGRFRHLSEGQLDILQNDAATEWSALLELEKRGRFPGY